MAGGRGVQNGNLHPIVHRFQNAAHQKTGMVNGRFAGFQINLHIIAVAKMLDDRNQARNVVIRAGDMMTAAEVEPVQLVQIFAEAFFKSFGSRFQVIGVLLAEGVEVQSIQQRQQRFIEVGKGSAQSGAGCARVIDGMTLLGGMFGIDAQTDGFSGSFCP